MRTVHADNAAAVLAMAEHLRLPRLTARAALFCAALYPTISRAPQQWLQRAVTPAMHAAVLRTALVLEPPGPWLPTALALIGLWQHAQHRNVSSMGATAAAAAAAADAGAAAANAMTVDTVTKAHVDAGVAGAGTAVAAVAAVGVASRGELFTERDIERNGGGYAAAVALRRGRRGFDVDDDDVDDEDDDEDDWADDAYVLRELGVQNDEDDEDDEDDEEVDMGDIDWQAFINGPDQARPGAN